MGQHVRIRIFTSHQRLHGLPKQPVEYLDLYDILRWYYYLLRHLPGP